MDSWLQHWQLRFIACVPLFRHLREKLKDTFSIRSEKNGSVLGLGSQTPNLQTHFRIRSYFISLISISRTIDLCRATLYIARPTLCRGVCPSLSLPMHRFISETIQDRVWNANRNSCAMYRMVPFSMTSNDPQLTFEGHAIILRWISHKRYNIYLLLREAANSGQNHTVQHNTAHSSQIKKGTNIHSY